MDDRISIFERALTGHACRLQRREADWLLTMSDGVDIAIACCWRIVSDEGVRLVDEDHGQSFGLPEPIDAAAHANALFSEARVVTAKIDPVTADLRLEFVNGLRLELLNNSSGYEAWQARFGGGGVIGLGGGSLAFV